MTLAALPLIVISAPNDPRQAAASVVGGRRFKPSQVLFGADAQVNIAISALGQAGFRVFVTCSPEAFCTTHSFAPFAGFNKRAAAPWDGLVHLRFGPCQHARVLKRVPNILVSTGLARHRTMTMGGHPLADGLTAPAAFTSVLHFGAPPALLAAHGGALGAVRLPDAFMHGDLAAREAEPAERAGESAAESAADLLTEVRMQIDAFAEFDPARWDGSSPEVRRGPSRLFRRALIETLNARQAGMRDGPAFVLLPFDVSDPASVIPALLRAFVQSPGLRAGRARPVLMPFNEHGRIGALEAIVGEMRDRAAQAGCAELASRLFVGRLLGFDDVDVFAQLFPAAIVDGLGAEGGWTAGRLAHFGVRALVLGDGQAAGEMAAAHLACDEEIRIRVDDELGERVIHTRTVSQRAAAAAVHGALALAASAAEEPTRRPAMPAPAGEVARAIALALSSPTDLAA